MEKQTTIRFEEVPRLMGELMEKVDFLVEKYEGKQETERDFLMNISELQDYLPEQPAKQTIYQWVNARKIPFQKHGKTLYFRKSAIDEWKNNGRQV